MDDTNFAWAHIGRAAFPEAVKRTVLQFYPDPLEALHADLSALSGQARADCATGPTLASRCDPRMVAQDTQWLDQAQRSVIGLTDPLFPSLLGEISCPPTVLYCEGDSALLREPALAIVGSRNPTPVGAELAHAFAMELSASGIVVVSGLALGIDSAAHRGALKAPGPTIAVCATGLDTVYPRTHQRLARQVTATGLTLSEFPPGTGVRRHHFPQRNRIISGLSLGTLVVEAAGGSGSLITAGFAADQGREVFAIPGSVHSPLSRGPHQLIRDGACLVESVQQILQALPLPQKALEPAQCAEKPPSWCSTALTAIDFAPTSVDLIAKRSGLTISDLCAMLIRMELAGLVRSCRGGFIRLN